MYRVDLYSESAVMKTISLTFSQVWIHSQIVFYTYHRHPEGERRTREKRRH